MSKLPPGTSPNKQSRFWADMSPRVRAFLSGKGADEADGPLPAAQRPPEAPPVPEALAPEPELNRAQRRQERATAPRRNRRIHLEERDRRRFLKQREKVRALTGNKHHPGPRMFGAELWEMNKLIESDPTGAMVRVFMRAEPNKVGCGVIREAALVPDDDGHCLYTWADRRARRIAAIGLTMLRLAVPVRKRKGRWGMLVRGIPEGAFAAAIQDPCTPGRDERPCHTAMSGKWRSGDYRRGECGYIEALRQAGFTYGQQLPASARETQDWEILGASGRPTARHWLVTNIATAPFADEEKQALLTFAHFGVAIGWDLPHRATPALRRQRKSGAVDPPPVT